MVYSHQPCPDQLEHRASLLLICLTRLTNHPDIPKQQLPAITSSRTHVPISCTAISSLALDLGQISALGCSRARCSIQDPGNCMEHPLAAGQDGSPLPVLFCTYSSLPFASIQGWQLLPPQVPVLGGRSQSETGTHVYTGEQQCLFPSNTSCQAAKRSEFYTG